MSAILKFVPQLPKFVVVRYLLPRAALLTALLTLGSAPAALADTASSSNWSGYAAHRAGVRFTRVSANWSQPSASCSGGQPTYSAMWVGLGGFAAGSNALEQIGTEVDCTASGKVSTSAWYELVPSASRNIRMSVRPGDAMSASVAVSGHRVTLTLTDHTSHKTFRRTVSANLVDVSSAEWILEAPSECVGANSCQTLPLANFGSTSFTSARARSARGHVGAISDRAWGTTKVRLAPSGQRFVAYNGTGPAFGTATPSALTAGGSSFMVTYGEVSAPASPFLAGRAPVQASRLVHPAR
jgi:hypothetical protein